jgi:hypothetical protein
MADPSMLRDGSNANTFDAFGDSAFAIFRSKQLHRYFLDQMEPYNKTF